MRNALRKIQFWVALFYIPLAALQVGSHFMKTVPMLEFAIDSAMLCLVCHWELDYMRRKEWPYK